MKILMKGSILVFALMFMLGGTAVAADLTVSPPGEGGQYNSIQAAIGAAVNGDTVLVYPGEYLENIAVISKNNITIKSTDGPLSTIIRKPSSAGWDRSTVMFLWTNGSTISGFTIIHDVGFGNPVIIYGGGTQTITNNVILGGYRGIEGYPTPMDLNVTITNNVITNSLDFGIFIQTWGGKNITGLIANNTITNVAVTGHGGIGVYSSGGIASMVIANNIIYNNGISGIILVGNEFDDDVNISEIKNNIIGPYYDDEVNTPWEEPWVLRVCIRDWTPTYATTRPDIDIFSHLFNVDPMLISNTMSEDDNHLQIVSPSIDSGTDDVAPYTIPGVDADGNPRIVDGDYDGTPTVDMGAFEFGSGPFAPLPEIVTRVEPLQPKGMSRSLIAKLEAVMRKVNQARSAIIEGKSNAEELVGAARNVLAAFKNEVEAAISGNKIEDSTATILIEQLTLMEAELRVTL